MATAPAVFVTVSAGESKGCALLYESAALGWKKLELTGCEDGVTADNAESVAKDLFKAVFPEHNPPFDKAKTTLGIVVVPGNQAAAGDIVAGMKRGFLAHFKDLNFLERQLDPKGLAELVLAKFTNKDFEYRMGGYLCYGLSPYDVMGDDQCKEDRYDKLETGVFGDVYESCISKVPAQNFAGCKYSNMFVNPYVFNVHIKYNFARLEKVPALGFDASMTKIFGYEPSWTNYIEFHILINTAANDGKGIATLRHGYRGRLDYFGEVPVKYVTGSEIITESNAGDIALKMYATLRSEMEGKSVDNTDILKGKVEVIVPYANGNEKDASQKIAMRMKETLTKSFKKLWVHSAAYSVQDLGHYTLKRVKLSDFRSGEIRVCVGPSAYKIVDKPICRYDEINFHIYPTVTTCFVKSEEQDCNGTSQILGEINLISGTKPLASLNSFPANVDVGKVQDTLTEFGEFMMQLDKVSNLPQCEESARFVSMNRDDGRAVLYSESEIIRKFEAEKANLTPELLTSLQVSANCKLDFSNTKVALIGYLWYDERAKAELVKYFDGIQFTHSRNGLMEFAEFVLKNQPKSKAYLCYDQNAHKVEQKSSCDFGELDLGDSKCLLPHPGGYAGCNQGSKIIRDYVEEPVVKKDEEPKIDEDIDQEESEVYESDLCSARNQYYISIDFGANDGKGHAVLRLEGNNESSGVASGEITGFSGDKQITRENCGDIAVELLNKFFSAISCKSAGNLILNAKVEVLAPHNEVAELATSTLKKQFPTLEVTGKAYNLKRYAEYTLKNSGPEVKIWFGNSEYGAEKREACGSDIELDLNLFSPMKTCLAPITDVEHMAELQEEALEDDSAAISNGNSVLVLVICMILVSRLLF